MTTFSMDDLKRFAERVERLCDFMLNNLEKDGTPDVVTIQKLKEDAADIQHVSFNAMDIAVTGLDLYMKGASTP